VSIFVNDGGIPAVYHGPQGTGAHGDREWIDASELERAARVYVQAARHYLNAARGEPVRDPSAGQTHAMRRRHEDHEG
jgi:hypothetical protein